MEKAVDEAHTEPTVVSELRQALEKAAQKIDGMGDLDEAFRVATAAADVLQEANASFSGLRARIAAKIWRLHRLDLTALGERLSISKSRAGQFVKAARKKKK